MPCVPLAPIARLVCRDCAGLRRLYPPRRNAGVAVLDDVARLLGAGNQLGGGCGGQQNPVSALGNGNPSRKRVEAPHIVAVAVFPRIVQRFNVQRLLWRHSRRGKGCAHSISNVLLVLRRVAGFVQGQHYLPHRLAHLLE